MVGRWQLGTVPGYPFLSKGCCVCPEVLAAHILTRVDPAHWENIRRLPNPPEFTTGLPTPSPRVLYFTKDGRLIVTYLDHGLV